MVDPVTQPPRRKRLANKGRQSQTVLTVNGRIQLVRRWYSGGAVGSVAPVDEWLDVRQTTVTVGVREMACRLNHDSVSFNQAADNLHRLALVKMSGEQLRQLVLAEGQMVLEAQRTSAIPTAFRAVECVVAPTVAKSEQKTRLYTGLDGVMVPLITEAEKATRRKKVLEKRPCCGQQRRPLPPRKTGSDQAYKEFKAITFYDERGKHGHTLRSRRPRKRIGALVRREALRLGQKFADEKIGNVDGASWIKTQLEAHPRDLVLDGLGLDFYHLSQNVHRCRRQVFGDPDAAGQIWATTLLHTLQHEGYQAAWDPLTTWRATLRGSTKKAAADRLLNYIRDRRDRISYPEFLQRGWQIGSGPTESRCKTSTTRLKARSRRWDAQNAESVASLTCLQDSAQWSLYWPTSTHTKTSTCQ